MRERHSVRRVAYASQRVGNKRSEPVPTSPAFRYGSLTYPFFIFQRKYFSKAIFAAWF
jgi:hypothetical protein